MTFTPTDYLPYDFANRRHIGPSPTEMAEMLNVVEADDLNALIDDTLPAQIRQAKPLDFGEPMSELVDWSRISRHSHAACNPKEYLRKSGLVHGLYPVSA